MDWLPRYVSESRLGIYESAAVSTDAAPCAPIGRYALSSGGSAVDAAIAILLCIGVINPQSSGLGGGFLMLHYDKAYDTVHYIDAREVAPSKATENMFMGNATLSQQGGLSIAVPTELAGMVWAHDQFGRLPWPMLILPTIKLCENGITVNEALAEALQLKRNDILSNKNMRNVFVDKNTGDVYKAGDVYKRLDLAETLKTIANEKYNALYGPSTLTTNLLKDLKDAGSIITREDLESYFPRIREPVKTTIRDGMTVYGSGLPGSGSLIAFMLNVLDGYGDIYPSIAQSREKTITVIHRIIETMKFAYANRMYLEDSDAPEVTELVRKLTDKSFADEIRQKIDDYRTHHNPSYYGVKTNTTKEDHGTAHLAVVASNGDAVSVTSTINYYFGSLVMSPSTGILLNNEMDDFSSPQITNSYGVPPTEKNHVYPGRSPFSSMSPTIILDQNGNVRLAVGGAGGTKITNGVAQVTIRNMWLGENIKQAIDAPRFYHQLFPNYVEYERNFPQDIIIGLREKGHTVKLSTTDMPSTITGIARDPSGTLQANSDYRRCGGSDGY